MCASGSGPGLWHQIPGPRVMWLHNPVSRPHSASPPNAASAIRRHHLMRRYQSGVTTQCSINSSASPPNVASALRRHHPTRRHISSSPPNAASGNNSASRPDPIRRQGTIRRQTMWRHNSASPLAMQLQEFGFGVRSFATLPQAAALCIYI